MKDEKVCSMRERNYIKNKIDFSFLLFIIISYTMGRNYYGDINGKFWFACQCSTDASNFGVMPTEVYYYYVCGCKAESDTQFCNMCYQNFDEHLDAYIEEYENQTDILIEKDYYIINFEFDDDDDLQRVQDILTEMKYQKPNLIDDLQLVIDDGDRGYEYTIEWDDNENENDGFVARYCLGRQIEKCLIERGICNFDCEL